MIDRVKSVGAWLNDYKLPIISGVLAFGLASTQLYMFEQIENVLDVKEDCIEEAERLMRRMRCRNNSSSDYNFWMNVGTATLVTAFASAVLSYASFTEVRHRKKMAAAEESTPEQAGENLSRATDQPAGP